MDMDVVRQIKERLDIVELVGDYVVLRRVGRQYQGLCPFHSEKTPSFYVSPERQSYHCFGCGAGGDVFSFFMAQEGVDFAEARRILAQRTGVPLPERFGKGPRGGDALAVAQEFFLENLRGAGGEGPRNYLKRRQLSREAWDTFGLGWALPSWDALGKKLRDRGVEPREAERAGLLVSGERGTYDRFRGRITFPIRDVSGRLVAFGGRLVDGEGAKYVNSPEGELFRKRETLYLLSVAKRAMREKGRSILVEGYMDALRLQGAGFPEAVASLGTALTEEQAELLLRFAPRCFICYDSDSAGQEAALRGMYVLAHRGLDVRVVMLPAGKDPDDLLSAEGGAAIFSRALEDALPLVACHLALRRRHLEDPALRGAALKEIEAALAPLSPVEVAPHVPLLAAAFRVDAHEVLRHLAESRQERGSPERGASLRRRDQGEVPEKKEGELDPMEGALVYLLWTDGDLRRAASPEAVLPLLASEVARHVAAGLLQGDLPEELEDRWHRMGDLKPLALLAQGGAQCAALQGVDRPWQVVRDTLERRLWLREVMELKQRFRGNEADGADMRRLTELERRLKVKGGGTSA